MKMSVEEEDKGIGDAPSEEGVDDGGERLRMEDFVVVKDASEMDRGDGKPENGLIRTGTAAALANLHLINPFVHTLDPGTVVDLIQSIVSSFILLPLRILAIIILLLLTWAVAIIGLWGMSMEDITATPLTGWRKNMQNMARILMRGVFVAGTFHRIKTIGQQASAKEAPIVVVAPHSSFFDSLVALITGPPSVVAKAETASLPFFGKLIDFTQPIYVCREDPNSRQTTIQAIKERANSKEDWPPLLIFPEGTCTNRGALISFKLGAFYPGVPVQPIIIRYPNRLDTFTWTWAGPGVLRLLWLTLTKMFSNCEVEFMPVYVPNEEEKRNPKLFAKNVRQLMSKALDMPVSDYTYSDCKTLSRAKEVRLPRYLSVVAVEKLRQTIGLTMTNIEEQIIAGSRLNDKNYRLSYEDFCSRLQIWADGYSQQLFSIFEKDEVAVDAAGAESRIDFREYLLCALFLIKFKQPPIQLIERAFELYASTGEGRDGTISKETFTTAICSLLGRKRIESSEAAERLFDEIPRKLPTGDRITFDEFSAYAEQKPKYSYLFTVPKDYAP